MRVKLEIKFMTFLDIKYYIKTCICAKYLSGCDMPSSLKKNMNLFEEKKNYPQLIYLNVLKNKINSCIVL